MPAIPAFQVLLEQGDGPLQVAVAPMGRGFLDGGTQHGQKFLMPGGVMGMAAMVEQCPRRGGVQVMVQPTADAPPVDTQFGGDVAEGMARVQVQQSQGAPQDGSVVGIVQLLTQAETLLRGQVQVTHDHPPGAGRTGAESVLPHYSREKPICPGNVKKGWENQVVGMITRSREINS